MGRFLACRRVWGTVLPQEAVWQGGDQWAIDQVLDLSTWNEWLIEGDSGVFVFRFSHREARHSRRWNLLSINEEKCAVNLSCCSLSLMILYFRLGGLFGPYDVLAWHLLSRLVWLIFSGGSLPAILRSKSDISGMNGRKEHLAFAKQRVGGSKHRHSVQGVTERDPPQFRPAIVRFADTLASMSPLRWRNWFLS